MESKYFEITEPYYALIRAKDKGEAIEIYIEQVADDEEKELNKNIKEIDGDIALGKLVKCLERELAVSEALNRFKNEDILLIDSNLI